MRSASPSKLKDPVAENTVCHGANVFAGNVEAVVQQGADFSENDERLRAARTGAMPDVVDDAPIGGQIDAAALHSG